MAQVYPGPMGLDKKQFETLHVKMRRVLVLEDRHDLNCGGTL